jgi:hypothetical protein
MKSVSRLLAVPLSRRTRSLNGTPSVHSHESAGFRVRRAGQFVLVMVLTVLFTAVTGNAEPTVAVNTGGQVVGWSATAGDAASHGAQPKPAGS